ncbi:anillin-like [Hetaerina americana]|uniref:anillin-like n=1 Tax=Hetaerina americana TaxID=62018 RepID=UPI003A7F47C3
MYRKVAVETIIADQASKALQLCYSSTVFAGSAEQVECERLLLLSTMRKQALIDGIRCLKAQPSSNSGINQCVEVSVKDIKLHLKDNFMEYLIASKQQDQFYFLCIMAFQDTVLCTEAVAAKSGQPTINFPAKNLKMESELLCDMCICLSVYMLQVKQNKVEKAKRKQQKKSIEVGQSNHVISKHDSYCLLLCGSKESERNSKFLKNACEHMQTRVPGFILIGRGEIHLPNDIDENFCILQQYEDCINEGRISQPLHETVQFEISCTFPSKSLDIAMNKTFIQCQGFLTQFNMISGIAAWQRGLTTADG